MKEYTVTWQIQVDADSPCEAAKIAREMFLDSFPVFEVREFDNWEDEPVIIDFTPFTEI